MITRRLVRDISRTYAYNSQVRFSIFAANTVKIVVFWNVTPWSLVEDTDVSRILVFPYLGLRIFEMSVLFCVAV
jgi:hypothetical protein